jgi:hypothetical protein
LIKVDVFDVKFRSNKITFDKFFFYILGQKVLYQRSRWKKIKGNYITKEIMEKKIQSLPIWV